MATASNVAGRERSKTGGEGRGTISKGTSQTGRRVTAQSMRHDPTDDGRDGVFVVDSRHLSKPFVTCHVLLGGAKTTTTTAVRTEHSTPALLDKADVPRALTGTIEKEREREEC